MTAPKRTAAEERLLAAVRREVAAQRKIDEHRKNTRPSNALVVALLDAQREKALAKSEFHDALGAQIAEIVARPILGSENDTNT